MSEYLTVRSFSEKSGLSVQMVRKQIKNQRLVAFRQNSGLANWIIPNSELYKFVSRPARQPKPAVTTGSSRDE